MDNNCIIEEVKKNKKYLEENELIDLIQNIKNKNKFSKNNLEFIIKFLHKNTKKKKFYFNFEKNTKILNKNKKLLNSRIYLEDLDDNYESSEDSDDSLSCKDLEEDFKNTLEGKNNDEPYSSNYLFPENNPWTSTKRDSVLFEPFGTQWVHDKQEDDTLDEELIKRGEIYDKLRAVILPEQRSPEWFAMRRGAITASDGGVVLGKNKYEKQFDFILKKTVGKKFSSNKFCYHGKMLEEPATMIYQYRMNVTVEEFGLMMHNKYSFLGASPDGIVNHYKLDGKHKTKEVGKMLEIKCPLSRKINMNGPIKDHICPIYYWIQVQLQLECCNLEECDFWQCDIKLYKSREEFINDTDEDEPFRSKKFGFEKGCLLQLMPLNRSNEITNGKYWKVAHEDAKFIYPKNIEMSPYDCDKWVMEQLGDFYNKKRN